MKALVIGSSGGIGKALATRLKVDRRFEMVATLSRTEDGLEITDERVVEAHARRLADMRSRFDLIINATGALVIEGRVPEKTIKAISADDMVRQFYVNAIGPALLLKHFHHLLPRQGRSVFASLSARVGSIGDNRLGGWISYRAAKAAQNQIVKTAALEIARTHPDAIVVALHPGTVATALSKPFVADRQTTPADEAARRLIEVIEHLQADATGRFFSHDGSVIEW
jgi:NAD(P)-dependent dehydrogenase (short-subunit alcohol dehydrogenase family)